MWKNRKIVWAVAAFFSTFVFLVLTPSCKVGGKKNKTGDSTAMATTYSDSLASDSSKKDSKKKDAAFQLDDDSPVLTSLYISGGTAQVGSFDYKNTKFEDFNHLDMESNNILHNIDVESFYMDETEVANIHYLEYLYYVQKDSAEDLYYDALPDTTVWFKEMGFNDFWMENYLRYPGFRYYPVVGVSWLQANNYCVWRTAKVNEFYNNQGLLNKTEPQADTKSDSTSAINGDSGKPKNEPPSKPKKKFDFFGLFKKKDTPPANLGEVTYRLPTEAEWEYAAQGFIDNQYKSPEEYNKRFYPWNGNRVRVATEKHLSKRENNRRKKNLGVFLANFKRGKGDYAGIGEKLHRDGYPMTSYVYDYEPNDFGLFNVAGNVSEWCGDEFKIMAVDGSIEEKDEDDEGFLENAGDRYDKAGFQSFNAAAKRVYKGGSWNDFAYWLSPGARRGLEEDSATATIGFRCAMVHAGMSKKESNSDLASSEDGNSEEENSNNNSESESDKKTTEEKETPSDKDNKNPANEGNKDIAPNNNNTNRNEEEEDDNTEKYKIH